MSKFFLVVSIARRYIGSNIPFIHLIQQGNIGLIQAFSKFDPNKNTRFISYASVSIKNALSNFSATNRIVKVPKYFQKDVRDKVEQNRRLTQKYPCEDANMDNDLSVLNPQVFCLEADFGNCRIFG